MEVQPAMNRRLCLVVLPVVLIAACSSSGQTASSAAAPSAAESAAPSAAVMEVMGKGQLRPVDGKATGIAELVVLPDKTYEIVLDGFMIDGLANTNVVLVSNTSVTATGDVDKSKLLDLGPLTATEGMQTYVIPADMAGSVMDGYHSVVIWDTEMAHAIAAASLQ
jgi:hypothetical protein